MENEVLKEYIGETKTKKLIDEIQSVYFQKKKHIFANSKQPLSENCLVTALRDGEIKSIGMSCINDLLLDNFCQFWVGAFQRANERTLVQVSGVNEQVRFIGNPPFTARYNANNSVSLGTLFQVGSGATPPVRGNFNIDTAFPSAPEANRKSTGIGVYTVGLSRVNVAGFISPTTDAGTINEFVMFAQWQKFPQQSQTRIFALSRDIISPAVSFSALDTINIDYAIQI